MTHFKREGAEEVVKETTAKNFKGHKKIRKKKMEDEMSRKIEGGGGGGGGGMKKGERKSAIYQMNFFH